MYLLLWIGLLIKCFVFLFFFCFFFSIYFLLLYILLLPLCFINFIFVIILIFFFKSWFFDFFWQIHSHQSLPNHPLHIVCVRWLLLSESRDPYAPSRSLWRGMCVAWMCLFEWMKFCVFFASRAWCTRIQAYAYKHARVPRIYLLSPLEVYGEICLWMLMKCFVLFFFRLYVCVFVVVSNYVWLWLLHAFMCLWKMSLIDENICMCGARCACM